METTAPPEKANGLATYLSVLTSPRAAFEQLSRTPMWGWAAIAALVIIIGSTYISLPESKHFGLAIQQQVLAHATADNRAAIQQRFDAQNAAPAWQQFINPVIFLAVAWLISALVYLAAAALSGGSGGFGKAWVLAANAAGPSYLGLLVNSIILALRGPDSANSMSDLFAIPSLGMFASGSPALAGFLSQVNPFQLWYVVVAMIGLQTMLGTKRTVAVIAPIILVAITGLVYAAIFGFTAQATG